MIVTIVATLGVLGVLILVHELGHFVAARAFDIHVSRFSIGLGPKLLAFRRGETEFCISALPLGGYVKLTGMKEMDLIEGKDDGEQPVDPARTFAAKPASVRAVVLAAGVAMNAVLAVVLFAGVALVWGMPAPRDAVVGSVIAEWLPAGTHDLVAVPDGTRITRVGDRPVVTMDDVARAIMATRAGNLTFTFENADPVTITIPRRARDRQLLPIAIEPVRDAAPSSARSRMPAPPPQAGLQPGDRVLAIDGQPVATWQELQPHRPGEPRPGPDPPRPARRDVFAATLTPTTRYLGNRALGRMDAFLDYAQIATPRERLGPTAAAAYGFTQSWEIVTLMGSFVAGMFDGRHSAREMGGPIMIAQISGAASRAGIATLIFFAALLSINLAVINLLPIPALDGGHLALLALEKVRGRPAGERAHAALGRLGSGHGRHDHAVGRHRGRPAPRRHLTRLPPRFIPQWISLRDEAGGRHGGAAADEVRRSTLTPFAFRRFALRARFSIWNRSASRTDRKRSWNEKAALGWSRRHLILGRQSS
jgi:regulator of sigma E protease